MFACLFVAFLLAGLLVSFLFVCRLAFFFWRLSLSVFLSLVLILFLFVVFLGICRLKDACQLQGFAAICWWLPVVTGHVACCTKAFWGFLELIFGTYEVRAQLHGSHGDFFDLSASLGNFAIANALFETISNVFAPNYNNFGGVFHSAIRERLLVVVVKCMAKTF